MGLAGLLIGDYGDKYVEELNLERAQESTRAQRGLLDFVAAVKRLQGAPRDIDSYLDVGSEETDKFLGFGQFGQGAFVWGDRSRGGQFSQSLTDDVFRTWEEELPSPESRSPDRSDEGQPGQPYSHSRIRHTILLRSAMPCMCKSKSMERLSPTT